MTTQEKIKFIIQNWKILSLEELSEKLQTSKSTVSTYATLCRKHGINLEHYEHTGKPRKINWEELKQYAKTNTNKSSE